MVFDRFNPALSQMGKARLDPPGAYAVPITRCAYQLSRQETISKWFSTGRADFTHRGKIVMEKEKKKKRAHKYKN